MKVRIEIAENLTEDEIIIRCARMTDSIEKISQFISEESSLIPKLTFYKNNEEIYFPPYEILFFETNGDSVYAHTKKDMFLIKFRLYELEEMLPKSFVRISKSTILNTKHVLSIDRNLTSASLVKFNESHKQVFVSRLFYKGLRQKLIERRNYED